MKNLFYYTLTLMIAVMILCPPVIAQKLLLSTFGSTTLGGQMIESSDLVEYDTETGSASLLLDGSAVFEETNPSLRSIDAAHRLPNGNIVLSSNWAQPIGGLNYKKKDLVEYDPRTRTATIFLAGDTVFTRSGRITAVHVLDDGSIVFSVGAGGATIGELDLDWNDIVRYYPDTKRAEVILNVGAIITGGSFYRGVDALHILPNNNIVFSTMAQVSIGDLIVRDEDLVEYDLRTGTATLFFDGSDVFPHTDLNVADITAFSIGGAQPQSNCTTGGTVDNPIAITLNQPLNCELKSTDSKFVSGKHYKAFQLSSPGGQLTINATSNAFTPRFGRRDPSDSTNRNFFTYPIPHSVSDLPAGTFLFLISSTNPERFGSFSVVVTNSTNSANGVRSTQPGAFMNLPDGFEYEVLPVMDNQ